MNEYSLTPVQEVDGLRIKRGDLYAPFGPGEVNGGKLRQCVMLVNSVKKDYKSLLTYCSIHSPQAPITAAVARANGMPCRIVYGGTTRESVAALPMPRLAMKYGASIVLAARSGRHSILHARAKELAAQENSFIVQYGINIIGYGDTLLTAVAAQTENLPDDIENLVMTCGSGITATGVMIGLHRYGKRVKRMHLVATAPDRRGFIHETLKKYGADREFEYHDLFHSPGFVYEKSAAATWGGAFACILTTRQRRCSGLEAPASHRKAPYSGLRARSLAARDRAESEERRTMPNRTKDDLWERQPGESAQAYEAFAIYRDMGSNRSLRVVAEQLSKSDTLIKRWSREKKWGERCRAYDNHLDDVARQEALRKYKKMRTRHIGIALQLQEKALAELKNLPDGSMTPKDIIQFLDKATELERDNRMEEAGVTAGGKTAEEQEETTLSLADEIAAAYENRKRGEQT